MNATVQRFVSRLLLMATFVGVLGLTPQLALAAQPESTAAAAGAAPVHHGGEASLVVPDLSVVSFGGVNGHTLLLSGLLVSGLGLLFGLLTFTQLRNLPVHSSMREVSELIYETCKTYLITQG